LNVLVNVHWRGQASAPWSEAQSALSSALASVRWKGLENVQWSALANVCWSAQVNPLSVSAIHMGFEVHVGLWCLKGVLL
jgi:glucan biosynthesis protein